jgi:aromatic-amino-acid transaminase
MWSMPPDHPAACAHIILEDPELHARWLVELEGMRNRINSVRQLIAAADPRLSYIGRQFGMFSMLPLSPEQVLKLRSDHAIYMAESGRFNVVGMSDAQLDRFTAAVVDAMNG